MSTKEYKLHFTFTHIPSVMKRGSHALIVLKDEDGHYVLGAKHIYPQGIYRLIGGGLEQGEDPLEGATRELNEEFQTSFTPSQLTPLAVVTVALDETSTGKQYTFVTHIFEAACRREDLHPSDDLDGMKILTREQMNALVDRYFDLSDELISIQKPKGTEEDQIFRWRDYGKFYGKIHEIVLELTAP